MRKSYGEIILFIAGVSVGWNLKSTKKPQDNNKDAAQQVLKAPWYTDIILQGDMWDGKAPLGSVARPCVWKNISFFGDNPSAALHTVEMCLDNNHNDTRHVIYCEEAWGAAQEMTDGIVVNVGSDFGMCVLRMLVTTSNKIIAVEPHPVKLFHLTSTLLKLDLKLRERVVVLPMAAGSRDDTVLFFTGKHNYGSMHNVSEEFQDESTEVPIHRLDSVFSSTAQSIGLLRINTGGMTCDVLQGLHGLKVDSLLFETRDWAACSKSELRHQWVQTTLSMGFKIDLEKNCLEEKWPRGKDKLVCSATNTPPTLPS